MAVDAQDNIWVFQRPRSLTDDEKGADAQSAALEMLRRRRRRYWSSIRAATW